MGSVPSLLKRSNFVIIEVGDPKEREWQKSNDEGNISSEEH